MKKILGYKLKSLACEYLELPKGATIVSVLDSYGEPTLFAYADMDERETEIRHIYMVETGRPVERKILQGEYLGSISIANYGIVYHFYACEAHQ
jgi:hypothetical protein